MTGTFFSPSAIEILIYFFIWVFGLKKKKVCFIITKHSEQWDTRKYSVILYINSHNLSPKSRADRFFIYLSSISSSCMKPETYCWNCSSLSYNKIPQRFIRDVVKLFYIERKGSFTGPTQDVKWFWQLWLGEWYSRKTKSAKFKTGTYQYLPLKLQIGNLFI